MAITFERSALYEEVWNEPLTKLAKKYSLSDNGLRKICKAMSIPLPSAGHWAKVAAGHQIPRTPLPAEAEYCSYTSHPPTQVNAPFHTLEDDAWLADQDAYEKRIDGVIKVEQPPGRWHCVASSLREQIDKRLSEVQQWRDLAEGRAKRSLRERSLSPDFDSWKWKSFVRDGQLVMHAPLRVSQETHERALKIVNAMCYAAEARGFAIGLNVDGSRIELEGHGATVTIRMSERLDDKIRREPAYAGGPPENMEVKVPTGSLKLFVGSSRRSERDVAVDDSKGKIESKLNGVFLRINRMVIQTRELVRQQDAWKRKWAEDEARREARARRKEAARKRRRALYREVRSWQRAQTIREYVAQVVASHNESNADDRSTKRLRLWQSWASGLANKLDPTVARLARFRSAPDTQLTRASTGGPDE
jgi:hypothetical protein